MDTGPAIPAHWPPAASPRGEVRAAQMALEAQMALLDRLAEYGVQIAQAMARQVSAPAGAPLAQPAPQLFQGDVALGFSRVARAVRLTVALHAKLLGDLAAWGREAAPARADVVGVDDGVLAEETEPPEKAEPAETVERLGGPEREPREAPDDIHALLDRPFDEVVDLICRDLGVSPEWARQAQAAAPREGGGAFPAGRFERSGGSFAAQPPSWRTRHDASP